MCGIPQGCPVSCLFANVAAYMWIFETRAHNLQLYAYLDDWIGIGHEWSALSHMMDSTMKVCGWTGTTLNTNKSVKMVVSQSRNQASLR